MDNENYEKIVILEGPIEAELIASILNQEGITHMIRSFHDTAYDGLFQTQKGWGELRAPASVKTDILEIIRDVRKQAEENINFEPDVE